MPTESRLVALFADLDRLPLPAEGSWLPSPAREAAAQRRWSLVPRLYVALAAVLLVLLAITSSAVAGGGILDRIRDFAHAIGIVRAGPEGTALVVDGVSISERTIAVYQASIEQNGIPAARARQQALDKAITEVLTDREATRRGVLVSDDEVAAFIAQQRELNASAPPENQAMFKATLDGLGMTEEQYWADPATRSAVRAILVHGKLVELLTPAGGTRVDGEKQLALLVADLKAQAVIRYGP